MSAFLILAFSVVALLRFAIYQWRLIWLTTANQPLSDSLRAAAGSRQRIHWRNRLQDASGSLQ